MSDHSGNGHNKGIFDLAPKQDPLLAQVVPAARKKVCLMTRICEGARMFYCYITDSSLTPGQNSRKGVVKFSDFDLSMRFKVNPKTIRNWKRALESTGEIWLTEKFMKNSFPQTVYNVTAIVGQATLPVNSESEDGSLVEDEVFSSNRRRQLTAKRDPGKGTFVCLLHARSGCELCRRRRTPPGVPLEEPVAADSHISSKNEPYGKILPSSTAIDCRPPRQMVAGHRGKWLPTPSANGCRPARQMVAAVGGNGLPTPTANGFRRARQTVADNGKTQDRDLSIPKMGGNPPPPEKQFEIWVEGLDGLFPSRLRKLEAELKAKLQAALSDEARREWKRRLEAVRDRLHGGPVKDDPAKPARKPATPTPKPSPPTEQEMLDGARYLVTVGKTNLLTPQQKAALKAAGE